MRTISTVGTPLFRYAAAPYLAGCGLFAWFMAYPIFGTVLLVCAVYGSYVFRRLSTVRLGATHLSVRNGSTEMDLRLSDVKSVRSNRRDYVRITLHDPQEGIGETITFLAKARLSNTQPHPIVLELRELCGLTSSEQSGSADEEQV